MFSFRVRSNGDTHDPPDLATSCGEAWAEFDVDTGSGAVLYGMALAATGVDFTAQVSEGFMAITYIEVLTAGENAFSYPDGAELHPDDSAAVTSAQVVGQIYTIEGDTGPHDANPTSIRQVAMADYDVIAGPVFHGPARLSAADVVVPQVAGVYDEGYPFAFDIAWDEVGGGAQKAAMYVTSIDTFALSGSAWDDPFVAHFANVIDLTGTDNPQWVATVRLPRYRVEASPPASWLTAGTFYYADVGLYLGADFTDLVGLPDTLPVDCDELDYVVLRPGVDPTAGDYGNPEAYADYYIYNDGGTPTNDSHQFGTVPETGSHLWVTWFGPLHSTDPGDDPIPTPDPASLVPSALAAGGTG